MSLRNRDAFPAYGQSLTAYLADDARRLRESLASAELSQVEKAMIRARIEMRAARLEEAREILDSLRDPPEPFFRAERSFLRATIESRSGNFERAVVENLRALALYAEVGDARGRFLATYNLSVDYGRLGLHQVSGHQLELARKLARSDDEKNLVLRAFATAASQAEDWDRAIAYIEEALRLTGPDLNRRSLQTVAADIFVRAERFEDALRQYDDFSTRQNDPELGRATFEYQCLKFLVKSESWPRLPEVVAGKEEYALKWRVLRHLDQGELEEAERAWEELRRVLPNTLGPDFHFLRRTDERAVFGRALEQLRVRIPEGTSRSVDLSPRVEALVKLFEKRKLPMRKEEIIERLWGGTYDPAMDARFYKLLSRLRATPGFRVELKNRRYRIERV